MELNREYCRELFCLSWKDSNSGGGHPLRYLTLQAAKSLARGMPFPTGYSLVHELKFLALSSSDAVVQVHLVNNMPSPEAACAFFKGKSSKETVPLRLDIVELLCGSAGRELVLSKNPILLAASAYQMLTDMDKDNTFRTIKTLFLDRDLYSLEWSSQFKISETSKLGAGQASLALTNKRAIVKGEELIRGIILVEQLQILPETSSDENTVQVHLVDDAFGSMKATRTTVPLRLDVVEFLCGGALAREVVLSRKPPIFMTVNAYSMFTDTSLEETKKTIEAALSRT
ncbi:MAG: hypothetical protein SGARI_004999 [Bacillariaceae sp.]